MTEARCEQLDEYLCGFLPPDEAVQFEAHLAACPTCREEAASQCQIDRLLAEGTAQIEPVPIALARRIEHRIQVVRRRRHFAWAGTLVAAATILLALALWGTRNILLPQDDLRSIAQQTALPAASEPQPATVVHVTPVDPSSAIYVPMESHSPNVTLICVYPTTKVNREESKHPSP
jgi:anti-sigma factor RsiW